MRKRKFTRQVGVVMSDETYDLLVQVTDRKELPVSEFIRGIVENRLQEIGEEEGKHGN